MTGAAGLVLSAGLTCVIATAMRALNPKCKIYAAQVATAAPLAASLAVGSPQTIDYQPSFVDGIGAKARRHP